MSGLITVRPDDLRAAAAAIQPAVPGLTAASRALRHAPRLAGASEVAAAWADFQTAWSTALAALAEDASWCARSLAGAATDWEELDRGVRTRLGPPVPSAGWSAAR